MSKKAQLVDDIRAIYRGVYKPQKRWLCNQCVEQIAREAGLDIHTTSVADHAARVCADQNLIYYLNKGYGVVCQKCKSSKAVTHIKLPERREWGKSIDEFPMIETEAQRSSDIAMSKYDPLKGYLAQQDEQEVTCSFAEVEKIIGDSLPNSALIYAPWWANELSAQTTHVQCRAWRDAGYSAFPNLVKRQVTFMKVGS